MIEAGSDQLLTGAGDFVEVFFLVIGSYFQDQKLPFFELDIHWY